MSGILGKIVRTLIFVVMILSGLGFIGASIAYVGGFCHLARLDSVLVPTLFPGLFVVWFPTVIVVSRMTRFGKQKDLWKIALSGCPSWMRGALYAVVVFGVLSFLYFMLPGNRENVPEALLSGGHMLIFYGVAFAVMYSVTHSPELLVARKCAMGHVVSPVDTYCPTCGRELVRSG